MYYFLSFMQTHNNSYRFSTYITWAPAYVVDFIEFRSRATSTLGADVSLSGWFFNINRDEYKRI